MGKLFSDGKCSLAATLRLCFKYVLFFTMSFSFLFSSFERNEALGKENESQQKKGAKNGIFVYFSPSISLSPLFLFKNHFIGVFLFLFLHVLQTGNFYALCRHNTRRPDVTAVLSVSINHTWRKWNGNGDRLGQGYSYQSTSFAWKSLALSY